MISVIGGAGFIGTALCHALARQGLSFQVVDLLPSRSFPRQSRVADILDMDALQGAVAAKGPDDTLVHLAAAHRDDLPDPDAYVRVNVEGTRNLCKLAEAQGIGQIVFTSSVAVYGAAPPRTDESGAVAPTTPYGHSKAAAEQVLRDWQRRCASRLTIVRPTVVFGPGNRGNVYRLLSQIAANEFVMVGEGANPKSMAYVGNVAAFLCAAVTHRAEMALFNYADGPDMTMAQLVTEARSRLLGKPGTGPRISVGVAMALGRLADRLARATGRGQPVHAARIEKFCAETSFCRANDLPDFVPPHTLQQGLDHMLTAEFTNIFHPADLLAAE